MTLVKVFLFIIFFSNSLRAQVTCEEYFGMSSQTKILDYEKSQKQQTPQQKAQKILEMLEVLAEHDVHAGYQYIDNVISETLNKVTKYLKKNPYFEQLDSETNQALQAVQQIDSKFNSATKRNWLGRKRIPTSEEIESILKLEDQLVVFEGNYHKQLDTLRLYENDLVGILSILKYEKEYLETLQNLLKNSGNKNLTAFIVPLVSKTGIVLTQRILVESLQESSRYLLPTIEKLHDQIQTLLHNRFPILAQIRQSIRISSAKSLSNEPQPIRVYDQNFDFRMTDQELLDAAKWLIELQKIIDSTLNTETRSEISKLHTRNYYWNGKNRYLSEPNLIAILAFHFRETQLHNNLKTWIPMINTPLSIEGDPLKKIDQKFHEQLKAHSFNFSKESIDFFDYRTSANAKILIHDLAFLSNQAKSLSKFQNPEQVILTYKMIMNLMLSYLFGTKASHKFAILSTTHQLLVKIFNLSLPPLDSAMYLNYIPVHLRLTLQEPDLNYYQHFTPEEIQILSNFESNLSRNANTILPETVTQLSALKSSPNEISNFMVKYGLHLKHPQYDILDPSKSELDLLSFSYLTLKIMRESGFYEVVRGQSEAPRSEETYSEVSVAHIKFMMERYGSPLKQYPVRITNTESILLGILMVLKKEDPQVMSVSHAEKIVLYKVYMNLLEHHFKKSSFFVDYVQMMRKVAHTGLMRKLSLSDEDVHSGPISQELE